MVTKELINNSMEAKWRKRLLAYFAIGFGLGLFLVVTLLLNQDSLDDLVWYSVFLSPFLVACLYETVRYFSLFSHCEGYEVYEVLLDRPTTSFLHKYCVYFTVGIDLKSGVGIFRKTKPLWSDHFLSKWKAWEYMNAKIQIAYDEERDRLLVLGDDRDWRATDE